MSATENERRVAWIGFKIHDLGGGAYCVRLILVDEGDTDCRFGRRTGRRGGNIEGFIICGLFIKVYRHAMFVHIRSVYGIYAAVLAGRDHADGKVHLVIHIALQRQYIIKGRIAGGGILRRR